MVVNNVHINSESHSNTTGTDEHGQWLTVEERGSGAKCECGYHEKGTKRGRGPVLLWLELPLTKLFFVKLCWMSLLAVVICHLCIIQGWEKLNVCSY